MNRLKNAISHPYKTARKVLGMAAGALPQSQKKIARDAEELWRDSHRDYVRDISHWVGEGRWSDEQAWTRIGDVHLEMFRKLCVLAGETRPVHRMVEWGPGGGANAVQFCSDVASIYGIDISAANLAECRRQLDMRGFSSFKPILIDVRRPERCLDHFESPVDFFLSTAVYQHFPSKEYGVLVTGLAYELLREGGIALIQIRYSDDSRRHKPKRRNYRKNVITFTAYGIVEFWQVVQQAGFQPLAVSLDPTVNYAYYYLKKRENNEQSY